jgi:hypothetical protein
MKRLITIAGISAVLVAGAAGAAFAQAAQTPAQRPAPVAGAATPGMHGQGMHGQGMHGQGMRQGMRGQRGPMGVNGPLTPAERQARVAAMFAQLDANKDGRATFAEFQAHQDRQRVERQRRMFEGLSGGQDSVTLEQLNTRMQERMQGGQGGQRRGGGGRGR